MDMYGITGVVIMGLALVCLGGFFGIQGNLPTEKQCDDIPALLAICGYTVVFFFGVTIGEPVLMHAHNAVSYALLGVLLWLCGGFVAIALGYTIVYGVKALAAAIHHSFES